MLHKDKLDHYHGLLLQWQKTINLISPTTLDKAWERHFEDSVQLLDCIPDTIKSICDIGSGAGFPALVLAILRPDIDVSLIESDVRKCVFLRTVSRETSLNNVTIYNERIEDRIDKINVDMVTSRALASVRQLIIYTQPVWSKNAELKILMPKGKNWQEEIDEAKKKFTFDFSDRSSKTDELARILTVGNITQK